MRILAQPSYKKLGYTWSTTTAGQQLSWLQFADDAAIVASDNKAAQALLNLFQAWCSWSGMTIRLDKCSTFGMKKIQAKYMQTMPQLSIGGGQIPQTQLGGDFKYLGRLYNFEMADNTAKDHLESNFQICLLPRHLSK